MDPLPVAEPTRLRPPPRPQLPLHPPLVLVSCHYWGTQRGVADVDAVCGVWSVVDMVCDVWSTWRIEVEGSEWWWEHQKAGLSHR